MTVKTGQSWAGTFVTLDSTGALAAGTPSGVLYVDGTANGATVTISGSNPYKWSVTLPSLTAGQRVDMYITGTIATIATAGFVASEQADTALTSEVKTDTAAILADTGTDGVVLTAAGLKADAVAEIADGVWDEAIAGHTTTTTFGGKNQKVVPSETINDYKADVSALTNVKLAADQSGVTIPAVTTVTNLTNAPTAGDLTATMKSSITTAASSATPALSAAGVDAILDEVVVGTYTMRQLLTVMSAALAGKLSGGGTTTLTFRGIDDASNVIVATVDASGNRSALTITV